VLLGASRGQPPQSALLSFVAQTRLVLWPSSTGFATALSHPPLRVRMSRFPAAKSENLVWPRLSTRRYCPPKHLRHRQLGSYPCSIHTRSPHCAARWVDDQLSDVAKTGGSCYFYHRFAIRLHATHSSSMVRDDLATTCRAIHMSSSLSDGGTTP